MNWKHYLAIATPYVAAAALGLAEYMTHSSNALEVTIGGLIVAVLSHQNVLTHAENSHAENSKP